MVELHKDARVVKMEGFWFCLVLTGLRGFEVQGSHRVIKVWDAGCKVCSVEG